MITKIPKQCARWLATLAIAAAMLLLDADSARADVWSLPSDCGCTNESPTGTWGMPQLNTCLSRPFWMRPTPPYNSSWQQVPVTTYQSQVVNDPLSGVSVATLQPCSTSEWQQRRTPGCALWQGFVNWWRSRCCLLHGRSMSPAAAPCAPANNWVVSSPQPAASPYYAPSTSPNGRLVPAPSSGPPTSPTPADSRPQLEPLPQRPAREGAASRLLPPGTEVFVRTLDDSDSSLESGPPLVAPGSGAAESEAAVEPERFELLPVSWSAATSSQEHNLPTDEVWDDTGWQSEQ